MNIEDGNRLIAEFMGGIPTKSLNTETWDIPNMNGYQFVLFYHSSWDWLMPVLEQIRNTDDVTIDIEISKETTISNIDRSSGHVSRGFNTIDNT